jgi:hypothetical protein
MFNGVIQENLDATEDENWVHQVKAFWQSKSDKLPSPQYAFISLIFIFWF